MNPLIEEALTALEDVGWKVKRAATPKPLPASVTKRHPELPPLAVEFFTHVESCVAPEEGAWLLAAEDFARRDDWRWDEYERMTIDDEDEKQAARVRAFWDRYLPIYYLVEGDYEYLAIGAERSSDHFGKVVWNAEAAYDEEPLVITVSYEDFLVRLHDVARRDPARASEADRTIARLILNDPSYPEGWWDRLKRWFRR
jgi:hypothetical protein